MRNPIPIIVATFLAIAAPVAAHDSRDPVKTVVKPLFDAVLAEDLAKVREILAPEATLFAMFNPNGTTDEASIRQFPALAYFDIVTKNYENIEFRDRTYSVTDDGRTVWMEASGNLLVAATGEPYRNRYVFKITIDEDGKVTNISEWVNTATLASQGLTAR
ncbi:nuclear transport factor 2 family protein [Parasphingorhabdus sp.]|uniref:nuclear transport factor 2 family protein n=1 Tax=Parasphingorhabdus sp. TaxID=2709688 RepID=UPI003BAFD039